METSSKILSGFKTQFEQYRSQAHFHPLSSLSSDSILLKYESGLNFFQRGDGYSALQTFKGLLESEDTPDRIKKEIHTTLGYLFLEQNRPKEALKEFTAIKNELEFKEKALFGIAWSFIEMKEYAQTITVLEDLISEFPEGVYAQESLSAIGFCYSKLMSIKNAIKSYQKALHDYNQNNRLQGAFIKKLDQTIPFNKTFIFFNPDPEWNRLMNQIKEESNGYQMIRLTSEFFKMENELPSQRPGLKLESPETWQSLLQTRNNIHLLFQNFIREEAKQQHNILENLSVQAAIELAKNLVLEKSKPGKESAVPLQEDTLDEYKTFLNQFYFESIRQAEALGQLGNLLMAVEKEQIREDPRLLNTPQAHPYSIGVYEKILSKFPSYAENGKILYQLAHGYAEENRKEETLSLLQELVTRFPKSSFYSEAMFRIGENYFEEGKYPEASEAYFKALQTNSDGALVERIFYKITWTYFKRGDYQKTVNTVIHSLNRYTVSRKNETTVLDMESLSESNRTQVKELLRLAALSFDFWGGVAKVRNYFDFHGHVSYENLIYRPLGHLFLSRGKFQEARQAFETFLALYPNHEEAPYFQMDLIETYRKEEKWSSASQATAVFIENYKPGSPWWKENAAVDRDPIRLLRKDLLFQQAQDYHGKVQDFKKREDYLAVIHLYQAFLQEFPKERETPHIQYFLGEVFFEAGEYDQAATQYEMAAYQYPLHDYSEEAGLAALISYEKIMLRTQGTHGSLNLSFYKSCQAFLKTFPQSNKKYEVIYKAMFLALQTGNTLEGRVFAQQILSAPMERIGVNVIGQTHYWLGKSYFDDHEYDPAEKEFKETLAWRSRPDYRDPDGPGLKEIKTFLASIQFKKAERFKNNQKWKEAGTAFFHIYEEFPDSEITPVSLINSGSAFLEIKDFDSALKAFLALVNQYAQSSYVMEARTALWTIYEKQNKWNEAIQENEYLIHHSTDPVKKNELSDKLFSLYFRSSNWIKLYQILGKELRTNPIHNPKWFYYYAAAAMEMKIDPEAIWAVENNLTGFNMKSEHDPEEEEWVMKSILLKGKMLSNQFQSIGLNHPLEKSLSLKKEKLKEAMDTFTLAVRSSYLEISSEAIYSIGNLFEQFANDLSRSERPKGLNLEQSRIYEELLKNQIDPLYQKANEIYRENVSLGNQSDNEWIKKSEEHILRLQAEQKGSIRERVH